MFDEFVYGFLEAALPLIRTDLGLSYGRIGALLAIPAVLSGFIEPVFGLLADSGRRRAVVLWGGAAFAASLVLAAGAQDFETLLVAYALLYLSSGAFTGLSEATLVDLRPADRERNVAWWVLAGSIGVVAGPLVLVASFSAGTGWRPVLAAMALAGAMLLWAMRRVPLRGAGPSPGIGELARGAVRSLADRRIVRWMILLQVQDLMVDVLFGFLALYFVDVVRTTPAVAGLAVAVWTAAGLVGDALVIAVLRRVPALVWLRSSAAAVAVVFPAFLLVPAFEAKLALVAVLAVLTGGWYAVPKARLYAELPETSGTAVSLTSASGLLAGLVPVAVGMLAAAVGLGGALWLCMLGPLGLLALLPREQDRPAPLSIDAGE